MTSFWSELKEFGKDIKESLDISKKLYPSSFKVSDELIRDRWGDKEETYHEWAMRIIKRVNEQLPANEDLLLEEYINKGAYVVYIWYALKEIHKIEGSGRNYYQEVWDNCRTLINMPHWKACLNPSIPKILKAAYDEQKRPETVKKYYKCGYEILYEYVTTKKLSSSTQLLELLQP